MDYFHQFTKLDSARSCLMLPHREGIAQSIAYALIECENALSRLDDSGLDDESREHVMTLRQYLDLGWESKDSGKGTMYSAAESFDLNDQERFSNAVNALANWFLSANKS